MMSMSTKSMSYNGILTNLKFFTHVKFQNSCLPIYESYPFRNITQLKQLNPCEVYLHLVLCTDCSGKSKKGRELHLYTVALMLNYDPSWPKWPFIQKLYYTCVDLARDIGVFGLRLVRASFFQAEV